MVKTFKPTYLYIKQHSVTGKLYFGKTIKNPEKYIGSGTHWLSHIKKHGREHVITLWYCLFFDEESCNKFAVMFSNQESIVESEEWLNILTETGVDNSYLEDTSWLSQKSKEYYSNMTIEERLSRNEKIKNGLSKMSDQTKLEKSERLIALNKSFKGKSKGLGRKTYKRIEYEKDMNKCKECSEPLPYSKRNNDYCSKKCANIVIGRNTKSIGGHETQKMAVSNTWKGKSRGKQTQEHKDNIKKSKALRKSLNEL